MSDQTPVCEPCGLETLSAPEGEPVIRLVDVEKTLDGKKVLGGVNLDIVITSYSIHYTKLYE